MKIAYFDAFSGISGDMVVGALLDAGADQQALLEGIASLGVEARCSVERVKRAGVAATHFQVHAEDTKKHRHLPQILRMIDGSALPAGAKQRAARVFEVLGAAEAHVHGVPIEKVHFHEVGAIDSICDIAGACLALELLEIGELHCSALNTGSGTVETEHGTLPVPAPATARLLLGKPCYAAGPETELTTPTGAAIVTALANGFGSMPALTIEAMGFGAGAKDFKGRANVLRVLVGTASCAAETTTVCVIETNIDDATPQVLGYAVDRLLAAGALDVTLHPVYMKKQRPGTLVQVLAEPAARERLMALLMSETTTLGVRFYSAERRVERRGFEPVETPYGTVRIKVAAGGAWAPEYEDCRALAEQSGAPLKEILAAAGHAWLKGKA
jgi:uncharacterized protein (TIGR00299 family) protein